MASAVTVHEMNAAMAPLQAELNRVAAQLATMQDGFNRGGQALADDAEAKKAELRTLNDLLRADTQAAFDITRNEVQLHRAALEKLPLVSQELVGISALRRPQAADGGQVHRAGGGRREQAPGEREGPQGDRGPREGGGGEARGDDGGGRHSTGGS